MARIIIFACLLFPVSVSGQGWEWRNPLPQGNSLWGIHFTVANSGWAVGWSGAVIHTTDRGMTWLTQTGAFPGTASKRTDWHQGGRLLTEGWAQLGTRGSPDWGV